MKRFALLLPLCVLLCLASCSRQPTRPKPAPPPYDAGLRDGSVIFWRGGLLVKPILKHTDSDITHAAIVLYQGREPWVYEAVPPRVHKVPMSPQLLVVAQHNRILVLLGAGALDDADLHASLAGEF